MSAARLWQNAWIVIPLLVPAAIVVGMIQGAPAAILVLIAAALIAVIALFWSSVRTFMGETPLSGADAYALAAPRAEEEQKQAVLRALKDLEFERSVGKISDEDYAQLVTQYRAEAKRLLRVLEDDARPGRARVESLVRERLVAEGLEPPPPRSEEAPAALEQKKKGKKKKAKAAVTPPPRAVEITPVEEPEKAKVNVESTWRSAAGMKTLQSGVGVKTLQSAAYEAPAKTCAECEVKNDPDANFCKKCGSKNFKNIGSAAPLEEGAPAAKEDADAPSDTAEDASPPEGLER